MKTVYVIAGEVSGDLHAANLIAKLKLATSDKPRFVGMGGPQMAREGVEIQFDYKDIAIMGFWEVLTQAKRLKKLINNVVDDILSQKPDSILLVDSSGFNLRVAKKIKEQSAIPIHYYIAPKIWAWGEWRIKKLKKYIDYIYCILPFEQEYFRSKNFKNAYYIGNPTLEEIQNHTFNKLELESPKVGNWLALLPGSRKQEITRILPTMLEAAKQMSYSKTIVACTDNFDVSFYEQFVKGDASVELVFGRTWDLLKQSDTALVTSGTATLETALIGCPQIVLYKTSPLSYAIGKRLIKVKYISLVNLILNKKAVSELIQNEANTTRIIEEAKRLNNAEGETIKDALISSLLSNTEKGFDVLKGNIYGVS